MRTINSLCISVLRWIRWIVLARASLLVAVPRLAGLRVDGRVPSGRQLLLLRSALHLRRIPLTLTGLLIAVVRLARLGIDGGVPSGRQLLLLRDDHTATRMHDGRRPNWHRREQCRRRARCDTQQEEAHRPTIGNPIRLAVGLCAEVL